MTKNNKNIIIGLGVVVLLAIVYMIFFRSADTPDITASAASSPAELYFVNLAGELNDLTFDQTVLQDPRFTSLVDIRTAILPEPAGRPDPFASFSGTK